MVIVKIIGGLGNQMFQYAYAKALKENGYDVRIDVSSFDTYKLHGGYQLNKFNIDIKESTVEENKKFISSSLFIKILTKLKLCKNNILNESILLFDRKYLNVKDNVYIAGYFQSESYFLNIRKILLEQFRLNFEISKYSNKLLNDIISSENSCSIHIRRGDYIISNNISTHGFCGIDYYLNAINFIENKLNKVSYFIFSDDIEWVKQNLKISNAIYVKNDIRLSPHEDLYMMSLCQNNIIANSTFSWWGAWLNKNQKKIVIAPKKWFACTKLQKQSQNIICKDWIKI